MWEGPDWFATVKSSPNLEESLEVGSLGPGQGALSLGMEAVRKLCFVKRITCKSAV